MAKMPNLLKHRKTGIWYFRKIIPADVQKRLGRKEVMESLGTRDRLEAVRLVLPYVEKWNRQIADARAGRLRDRSEEQLQALAIAWASDYRSRLVWGQAGLPDEIDLPIADETELDQRLSEYLLRQDIPIEFDSPDYKRFRFLAFQEHQAAYAVRPILNRLSDPGTDSRPLVEVTTGRGDLVLSKVFEKFRTESPGYQPEREIAVRRFCELIDDKGIDCITRADAREFRRLDLLIPKRLPGAIRKKSAREQIAWGDEHKAERSGPANVNKHIAMLQSLLQWARNDGALLDHVRDWSNPFAGVSVKDNRPQEEKKVPFGKDDLNKLFQSDFIRRPKRPEDRWLPLLALFTGATVEELAGLATADVRKDDGVNYLAITTENRRLKNPSRKRNIPVHPRLVELGFLRYVAERRSASDVKLFPDLRPNAAGKVSQSFSSRVNEFIHSRIDNKRMTFHSLRHNFKVEAIRTLIPDAIVKLLMGHAHGTIDWTVYAQGAKNEYEALYQQISKIEYSGVRAA